MPDCGDSSCRYAKTRSGMRTNGSDWAELGLVDAAVDALTSELDAAEQRGRQKALEEAAQLAEKRPDPRAFVLLGPRALFAYLDDVATAIRSLGSTEGGRCTKNPCNLASGHEGLCEGSGGSGGGPIKFGRAIVSNTGGGR